MIAAVANDDYLAFLRCKTQAAPSGGFEPLWVPDWLFDFQGQDLVPWCIRKGRSALLADCGLGKTPMELVWSQNVVMHTNRHVLIATPLAVADQFVREGVKFNLPVYHSRDGKYPDAPCIVVTNYERLHYFDPSKFGGGVADEASVLKAFDGHRRKQITRFFCKLPFRLLATATPSPNDYIELGTLSECLGIMTQSDMLNYFFRETKDMRHTVFKEGDFWNQTKWSFKPHSETAFWRWVVSWARGLRKPSDLGFDDGRFVLPPLNYRQHVVDVAFVPDGELFHRPAISLHEQQIERRRTVAQRCNEVARLITSHNRPAIAWCHYNEEGDALAAMIPGAVQVAGKDSLEDKEQRLTDFAMGRVRVLVTKPRIGCWGLNLQHCGDMTFFPTHSFEQFYQGVRRCWRFGRTGPVNVDIVSSLGESGVVAGLTYKQQKAERMFASLVKHMNQASAMHSVDDHRLDVQLPAWLAAANATNL